MVRSDYALRHGLMNTPSTLALAALKDLCSFVLEPIRSLLGAPIHVTSGYRSPEVNRAIGGSSVSQHVQGEAADFTVQGKSNREVVLAVKASGIPFDQLILEHGESGWVHASYGVRHRREVLAAFHDPKLGGTAYRVFA